MTDRELLQMALDALELLARYENPSTKVQVRKPRDGGPIVTMYPHKVATEAAVPLRARLAQPEPEPVAWVVYDSESNDVVWAEAGMQLKQNTPLYTAPPQREVYCGCGDEIVSGDGARCGTCVAVKYKECEWQGLTDDEHMQIAIDCGCLGADWVFYGAAVERKLKEKNAPNL